MNIITNKIIMLLATPLFCISSMASELTPITLTVAVTQVVANRYHVFIEKNQKQAIDLTHLSITETNQEGPIRLVILQQAMHKAGLAVNIDFLISPNAKRSELMVQGGEALISMSWPEDTFKSSALFNQQDRIRGIFGLESNHALMKVKTLEELRKFSAVARTARKNDVRILRTIAPSSLRVVNTREAVFGLIAYRNIDFTLIGLHNEKNGFKRSEGGVTLVPVPGILIKPNASSHFYVSKKHKHGEMVYQALEKGLVIMREQGLIKLYAQQLQKFKPDLQHWKTIYSEESGLE